MPEDSKERELIEKSSVEEIRRRFDGDVERFSNLQTGQEATIDSVLAMQLVAQAAAAASPHARGVLDVGCGAGNYSILLLQQLPGLDITLLDLSRPMLDCAVERLGRAGAGSITAIQGDIRDFAAPDASFDIILAAAVLHHLRTDAQWYSVFAGFRRMLRPGGSVWVFDMVDSETTAVRNLMKDRYAGYLRALKGDDYQQRVFAYIEKEDSPRSLAFQLGLLRQVGFATIDVLHQNGCFAAYGAVTPYEPAAAFDAASAGICACPDSPEMA